MTEKNEMLALADRIDACTDSLSRDHLMGANVPLIVSALRAAASAEPVAWQPIETAPKENGVFVLAYVPGQVMDTMAWDDYRQAWMNGYDDRPRKQPTHWMPLPESPK